MGKSRVEDRSAKPPKLYVGLAFFRAADVRQVAADVYDSREEYLGHADVSLAPGVDVERPRGVALPPDIKKLLDERAETIARAAKFIRDEDPDRFPWRHGCEQ